MYRYTRILFWFILALALPIMTFHAVDVQAQDPLAPDGKSGEVYYAPFNLTVTLDGELSEWQGVPMVTIPPGADLTTGEPAVTFAAAADSEYLYFMGDVIDNNIVSGEHFLDYWNEDSIEFYVNLSGDLTTAFYTEQILQVTVPPINRTLPTEEHVFGGVNAGNGNPEFEVVETPTGWAVELRIPLKNDSWEITPTHGGEIGFQVHLNAASESSRDRKLIWSVFDTSDQSYLDPSLFGKLVFFEIGQTELPQAAQEDAPTAVALPSVEAGAAYWDPSLPIEERVEDLLARMSLEEKIGQMTLIEKGSIKPEDVATWNIGGVLSGGGGYPDPNTPEAWAQMVNQYQEAARQTRLAIPVIYGVDAVHGHNNVYGATIFPHNIGLGATRDPELVERICMATALEMAATGIFWDYSPVVAVVQDVRWGRTYEAYGEDTALVTELATACIRGLQGESLADPTTVLATPKHYVGDGATTWGSSTTGDYKLDQGVTEVDEDTLRAIHLPPYQAAIDAGAQNVMISFSSWGGMKMHAQRYLIMDVLRGEFGFDGFIVSDWGGIDQISEDYYEAVVLSINAGVDMNMVPYNYRRFIGTVKMAVENGDVSEERIDEAVRNILTVKFELGLFENPYSVPELLDTVGSAEHREIAREAVAKSAVLLKNENDALPIAPNIPTVFVAGTPADDIGIMSGGWTIDWQGKAGDITPGTTILEAIQNTVSSDTEVFYSLRGTFELVTDDDGNLRNADVGIVVVGERPYAEGVGDSDSLTLTRAELQIIERTRERVDTLIVVLISGRPLIITDQIENWDAVVAAWLPGTEGQGVADVLFGMRPFTGKLPVTWPRSMDQLPAVGVDNPLFPFGYGLETTVETATQEARPAAATPLVIDDFETDELFLAKDSNNLDIGYVSWGDSPNVTLSTVNIETDSELALPDQTESNRVLSAEFDIAVYGGFTHVFTDGAEWTTQDWRAYDSLNFWMYGGNSGGVVQVEIFDNRALDNLAIDSAERWYYRITDDFEGWRSFTIPFNEFQRRTDWQPSGAPDDGLGLDRVHGYAFGLPTGVGAHTIYLDNIILSDIASQDVTRRPVIERPIIARPVVEYPTGTWELIWSDEFDGEAGQPINAEYWTCEVGGQGWGNNEHQYYTDRVENVSMNGEGLLVITAQEETLEGSSCWYGECLYTSARCITKDKFDFTYGRIEGRMKVPYGQGIWPAFWMLGANFDRAGWPTAGEIDIMEHIGREPNHVYGTIHGPGYSGAGGIGSSYTLDEPISDDFHTFTLEWEPGVIRWYFDGELYNTITRDRVGSRPWVYDHGFFMLINLAVGGNWPGYPDETTVFPQTFEIDFIRVYQRTTQ